MGNVRLIARLDVKGPNLIKGVQLEGLRVLGSPNEFARKYYSQGADEIIFMDIVASLYGRNHLAEIIQDAAKDIFIPLTVGGGIRSVEDARAILRSGADKVAINTAAVKDPSLIKTIAQTFGSQCMVSSIEAKKVSEGRWEVYFDNGRERTGRDAIEWAKVCASKGAGEILITSVDREGTRRGFDLDLIRHVSQAVNIPVIASGGMGRFADLIEAVNIGGADAVAMADYIHYEKSDFKTMRAEAVKSGLSVRLDD
jgi:imidazole glycerol-phosphate synthase subunit HisF